jgi:ribosomal protein S27AE
MPEVPKATAAGVGSWSELLEDEAAPAARAPGGAIVASVDSPTCPRCGSPVVATSRADRICNTCGLGFTVVTARDELDLKADREVRSRAWNEERGRGRAIPKGAIARW